MNKFKKIVKTLVLFSPFAFSVFISYTTLFRLSDSTLIVFMAFLPLCFYWVSFYLNMNNKDISKLREQVKELERKIDDLEIKQ